LARAGIFVGIARTLLTKSDVERSTPDWALAGVHNG
jgi:hypothetical protein